MRRSVYIMLFILLCFSGTLMDVIIIRIFILFKIWETRSVWTDVLSTALRDSSNSRKSENVRSVSSKNFAELKLYFVRNSDVECTLISCVFPNADLMCHQLKGSSDNEKREFQRRVPSSKLKMDMCFSFVTLDTSHKQPVCLFSSHFNILASQSIFFFSVPSSTSSLLRQTDSRGKQSSVRSGPPLDNKEWLIFTDWPWVLKMVRVIPLFY